MQAVRQTLFVSFMAFVLTIAPVALHAQTEAPPARVQVEAFLEVTGFDVALESIRLSAFRLRVEAAGQ